MTNVVGLFETRDQARRAVEALKATGLDSEDMSIMMRDRSLAEEVAEDTGADNSEAVGVGALGGGVLGGMAGLLVGLGAITIPGIGPFLAAGPIAAALTGMAVGATAGGVAGALIHHGVSEEEAGFYSSAVERGGILITVKTAKNREDEVHRILKENGMKDTKYHQTQWDKNPDFQYDIDRSTEMGGSKSTDDRDEEATVAKTKTATRP